MIIQPKIRGFICTAAHPIGCSKMVQKQIDFVQTQAKIQSPKNVLIIGASTGYGLASRIVAGFAGGANTIGVAYERNAADKRTATPGWYNTAAFEEAAAKAGLYAKSINGDAFSQNIKQDTADLIREKLKQIDLVIYSVAAPRRTDPVTGETYNSVLKTVGEPFHSKTVDPMSGEVKEITIGPATAEEVSATEKVMGGEDWALWMDFLLQENLLAPNATTVAYTYIGPKITYPIYKEGTIGIAKKHLHRTAEKITKGLQSINGKAYISVNKALVTQASSAIPVVPLYIALLYKVMKAKNIHEGCIEQIYRLYKDHLCSPTGPRLDDSGFIRIDDLEMRADVQAEIVDLWKKVNTQNIETISDLNGYRDEFYHLFGFQLPGIDYNLDVEAKINIPSIAEIETVK